MAAPGIGNGCGHIPGARSIPLKELVRHLKDLPRDQEIVAYCRGPYCALAVEVVALLRAGVSGGPAGGRCP